MIHKIKLLYKKHYEIIDFIILIILYSLTYLLFEQGSSNRIIFIMFIWISYLFKSNQIDIAKFKWYRDLFKNVIWINSYHKKKITKTWERLDKRFIKNNDNPNSDTLYINISEVSNYYNLLDDYEMNRYIRTLDKKLLLNYIYSKKSIEMIDEDIFKINNREHIIDEIL